MSYRQSSDFLTCWVSLLWMIVAHGRSSRVSPMVAQSWPRSTLLPAWTHLTTSCWPWSTIGRRQRRLDLVVACGRARPSLTWLSLTWCWGPTPTSLTLIWPRSTSMAAACWSTWTIAKASLQPLISLMLLLLIQLFLLLLLLLLMLLVVVCESRYVLLLMGGRCCPEQERIQILYKCGSGSEKVIFKYCTNVEVRAVRKDTLVRSPAPPQPWFAALLTRRKRSSWNQSFSSIFFFRKGFVWKYIFVQYACASTCTSVS